MPIYQIFWYNYKLMYYWYINLFTYTDISICEYIDLLIYGWPLGVGEGNWHLMDLYLLIHWYTLIIHYAEISICQFTDLSTYRYIDTPIYQYEAIYRWPLGVGEGNRHLIELYISIYRYMYWYRDMPIY